MPRCAGSGGYLAEARLNEVMIDAAMRGAVGSVAVLFRVLGGRMFFSVLESLYLTPVWSAEAPDALSRVTEKYKVSGLTVAQGYEDVDPAAVYWFQRVWDSRAETWYLPWPVDDAAGAAGEAMKAAACEHGLGFVPMVWIRESSRW